MVHRRMEATIRVVVKYTEGTDAVSTEAEGMRRPEEVEGRPLLEEEEEDLRVHAHPFRAGSCSSARTEADSALC